MGYETTIEKYKEIYRPSPLAEILGLWNNIQSDLNVYVHSPFCPSICKFCHYKGNEFNFGRDSSLYDKYYYDYLPEAIAPFLPLIKSRHIVNYFFGGGTPSLMNVETMRFLFEIFPGFKDVKSKTFEIHPAVWTEDQLDILKEYNFNCCIIGIQSFEKSVLDRQKRLYATKEKIKELAQKIKERGLYLAIDLIYRMDPVDADDIFRQDLDCAIELDSDIITLQHNFSEIRDDNHIKSFFDIIAKSSLSDSYRWEKADHENPSMTIEQKKSKKGVRYLRNNLSYETYSTEIFSFLNTIDEYSERVVKNAKYPSQIGFGSYQNCCKNTFSSIRAGNFTAEYIEINNNWAPEYYITHFVDQHKIFTSTFQLIKGLKLLGTPPAEINVKVINKTAIKNNHSIFRKPDILTGIEMSWKERNIAVDEFIERVKTAFPCTTEDSSSIFITEI